MKTLMSTTALSRGWFWTLVMGAHARARQRERMAGHGKTAMTAADFARVLGLENAKLATHGVEILGHDAGVSG